MLFSDGEVLLMPPRVKITREQILDAAVSVIRKSGLDGLNARSLAQELHCSTQPILYAFATMEELKRAAYRRADQLHTEYLLNTPPERDPLLGIGLNYIRFAVDEPQLFRFLFQSGYAEEKNLPEMIDSAELAPVLDAMQDGLGMDRPKTRDVFLTLALFVHGYASLHANNPLTYDEDLAAAHLERAFTGAVAAVSQEEERK